MERIPALLSVFLLSIIATTWAERENKSSSAGLLWSTAKEEGDLAHKAGPSDVDDSAAAADADAAAEDLDGGFSTLDGMLQWAIGHSDAAKLKEAAQDVQRLSPSELKQRQLEIRELMEKLKMPSDAQSMQVALNDLNNSSLSLEDRHRALQELLILVEPIDNASDMCKLGGLLVIIRELNHPDTETRKLSAWILGKASQNNAFVQMQVLELGALAKLMKMVRSSSADEATKAFYAVSALIRNNIAGQELFYAEGGDKMLQDILSNPSQDIRLRRKAVFLVSDLADRQLENKDKAELPFFSDHSFLKSVVDLTASTDLDLQEKALVAIKNLLQLRTTEPLVFKDLCGLGGALEKMRLQLEDLMVEEYHKDYAMDVEGLRKEVELMFEAKLRKEVRVPT